MLCIAQRKLYITGLQRPESDCFARKFIVRQLPGENFHEKLKEESIANGLPVWNLQRARIIVAFYVACVEPNQNNTFGQRGDEFGAARGT